MKIVVTIGGSILVQDNSYKKFKEYAEIISQMNTEHKLYVVVGGGKPARDYISMARGLGASEALCDDVGIDVTRLNARLLITALEDAAYPKVPHNFTEALEYSQSGKLVVMGGTEPAHSTDAVGSILAEFIGADLLINATSVDGLYNKDPQKYSDAVKFEEITASDMMDLLSNKDIKAGTYEFFDHTAIGIIKRSKIKTVVVDGNDPENLLKAVYEKMGTTILPE
ncbi:MAG: UMP kinase [Methanobacteriaceae archaeon]|jgi:uridylate kinase|nr:UMP kinase [Methanobacteriaceae archaeon]